MKRGRIVDQTDPRTQSNYCDQPTQIRDVASSPGVDMLTGAYDRLEHASTIAHVRAAEGGWNHDGW